MSRIEELQGYRWARDICFAFADELRLPGGHESLLTTLKRGLVEKPAGYMSGVMQIIATVETVMAIDKMREKA